MASRRIYVQRITLGQSVKLLKSLSCCKSMEFQGLGARTMARRPFLISLSCISLLFLPSGSKGKESSTPDCGKAQAHRFKGAVRAHGPPPGFRNSWIATLPCCHSTAKMRMHSRETRMLSTGRTHLHAIPFRHWSACLVLQVMPSPKPAFATSRQVCLPPSSKAL